MDLKKSGKLLTDDELDFVSGGIGSLDALIEMGNVLNIKGDASAQQINKAIAQVYNVSVNNVDFHLGPVRDAPVRIYINGNECPFEEVEKSIQEYQKNHVIHV